MKQLAKMLGVAALLVLSACSGESDGPLGPDGDESSFSAAVGTTAFTASNFSTPIRTANRLGFWVSQIVGEQANTHRFDIEIDAITGPGTFPVGPGSTSALVYREVRGGGVTDYWRSTLPGGSGSVTITTLTSNRIAGNFSVTVGPDRGVTGTKTITGNFDIYSD